MAGIKPNEFWEITPRELSNYVQGFVIKSEMENDRAILNAWLGAGLHRQKRLPKLQDLIKKTEKKQKQSNEQMLAMVKALNSAFGGKVVENKNRD